MKSIYAIFLGIVLSCGAMATPSETAPELPALTNPATEAWLPGKFIWADYFTSDIDKARDFYVQLFGWEWREINTTPEARYGIFYRDNIAVAGMAYRASPDSEKPYGRWIYYISVNDVDATVESINTLGGSTLLSARTFANRGTFAIVADAEGAPFGVMHSSSGDPQDFQVTLGGWLWAGLYASDAAAATTFYQSIFGYQVHAPEANQNLVGYTLSKQGYARAGISQLSSTSDEHASWVAYIRVDDVKKTLDSANQLGGTTMVESDADDLSSDMAIVADPFGAPVGFIRWTFEEDNQTKDATGAQQ